MPFRNVEDLDFRPPAYGLDNLPTPSPPARGRLATVTDQGAVRTYRDTGEEWQQIATSSGAGLDWYVVTDPTYGAEGDGVTDDREAIQAAIDAANAAGGGVVYFPKGTYVVSDEPGAATWCLTLDGCENIVLKGAGQQNTIIQRKAATYTGDTHIIQCKQDAHFITIEDLTLDGNRANCTDSDEQRHGLYMGATLGPSDNFTVQRCSFINMRGDGIFAIGAPTTDPTYYMQYVMVRDCYFANQARSTGGAHQRGCRYFWYINNKFISSDVSDAIFDFETTAANYAMDGLWIEGNHMLHDRPAVAVSLTGRTDTDTMKHVYFINNTLIGGGIQLGSLDGALIQGNYIEGAIDAASNLNVIVGNALLNNVRILDNTIVSDTDTVLAETGAINIRHDTGPIFCNNIEIARNKVYVLGASAIDGIRCREPQDNIRIYDNEVYGMGVATAAGIRINLTISDSTQRDNWQVNGNTVKNFPTGIAMHTSNSTTPITMQSICHNHLYSDDASMTVGILLTVAHTTANSHTLAIHGNVYGSSVTTPISMTGGLVNIISIGGGASAGGTRGPGIWQVIGTPEGMVTSVIGGVAYRTDGAANLAHYTKASGTGNTGWVPDGEVLLSSTAGVDMNTGTATTLYTVPTGFSCVITRVVVRNASTSLTTASYSFGFNSAAFDNVIANATHTELTGSTLLTVLIPKIGATVGAAAGTFKVLMNTLQGGAATTTMEVYGYLF